MTSNAAVVTKEVLGCWEQIGPSWNKRSDLEMGWSLIGIKNISGQGDDQITV